MATDWNPTLPPDKVARRLWRWGYFLGGEPDGWKEANRQTDWTGSDFRDALARYQIAYLRELDEHTLSPGRYCEATERLLARPRCGCSDTQAVAEARWPDPCKDDITFAYLFDQLDPLSPEETRTAYVAALTSWNERIELQLILKPELGKQARIWATKSRLSGGTLAWSYLAMNSCAVNLEQRYNTAVSWEIRYLQGVIAHEVGHALGLQHINDPSALLYPYARAGVYLPQALDCQAMERLGYRKRTGEPPKPPEPPAPPSPGAVTVASVTVTLSDGRSQVLRPEAAGTQWS